MDLSQYINHATKHEWWQADTQGKSNEQIMRQYADRIVCPRCEQWAYRDKGYKQYGNARCVNQKCGWSGRSVTIAEYLDQKLYRR